MLIFGSLSSLERGADMRLLVISHTPHYKQDGALMGWGATVRELDQLAGLFTEVVHLAPLHPETAPESSRPYASQNIRYVDVKPAGGKNLRAKVLILGEVFSWLKAMRRELRQADAIHVRCPAGISLIGLAAVRLWGGAKPCWVKYAGNWQPQRQEPLSYRATRWWLRHNFHRVTVTVNGSWKGQPAHVVSFSNPSFSQEERLLALHSTTTKRLTTPLRLLFVGRVEEEKGAGRAIRIARALKERGVDFRLDIIGDGPLKAEYAEWVRAEELENEVAFWGWRSREEIDGFYRAAHFIVLPSSASEGWPKVLSEAMAFGVVPLASPISSIPQVLLEAKCGHAIPVDELDAYAAAIISYTEDRAGWEFESSNGRVFAERFTYEFYLEAVKNLFLSFWNIALGT